MTEWSDGKLLEQVCKGSKAAFSELFLRYHPILLDLGRRLGGEDALVEDCLQEYFLYLFEHRAALDAVRNPRVYLLTSFRRRLLRELVTARRRNTAPLEETGENGMLFAQSDFSSGADNLFGSARLLSKVINQLPHRQREVLYLRYYRGLSTLETAEVMGIARQTVLNTVHQALVRIRNSQILERLVD